MRTSRRSVLFLWVGIGLVVFVVSGASNIQAREPGEYPADDAQIAGLSTGSATSRIKTPICGAHSLRGQFGPPGSIDLLVTLHCAKSLALHATSRGSDENHAESDATPSDKSKWSIHIGRDRVMFTIGTKW